MQLDFEFFAIWIKLEVILAKSDQISVASKQFFKILQNFIFIANKVAITFHYASCSIIEELIRGTEFENCGK